MEDKPINTTLYSLDDSPPSAPTERREGDRTLTLLRVGSLIIGGRRELCLIKNISAGGMLVKAYCPVPAGTRLSIELKCGDAVRGTARWITGDTVGVEFDELVDVVALLASSMAGPRPRMPRVEIDCVAWIREGAETRRVGTLDVSQGGLKFASTTAFSIGGHVIVTLSGLPPFAGIVRWQNADCFGVTFNKVLPLPMLVSWLHEQRERLRAAG
ncbi:PilZ domain-containing protein [Sphingomonas sp.]|uniref:PilZ domain-containing protein n=1 Tax=Sphingomonas sp. TaxID=28214 RepID=UPI00286B30A6|nr:PilZ domain-containing protein [Sphingomonas sp.]